LQAALQLGNEFDGVAPADAIERVMAMRAQARAAKDWALSDRQRDALAQCGIELHDTKGGTTWTVV
jgi:cysteinyl-tRNA synthetase